MDSALVGYGLSGNIEEGEVAESSPIGLRHHGGLP